MSASKYTFSGTFPSGSHVGPIDSKRENERSIGVDSKRDKKSEIVVTGLCLLIAFGGFVFGWDTGTISGFVNMSDFVDRFGSHRSDGMAYLSNSRTGVIVSIFNIGCAFGGFLTKFGDVYGRKKGLIIVMIVYMTGIIIQISSQRTWYQFLIGRIISGLGVGGVTVLSTMFISETAPRDLRGSLVGCFQLMTTLGIFLGGCTTFGTKKYPDSAQWRIPLALCFLWTILMIVGTCFMPESPRYLISKNKIDAARRSIAKVLNVHPEDPVVKSELDILVIGMEEERAAGTASWGELITGKPKIFYRVTMGIMIQSLQQLTGVNYFFYYGTTIFKSVGMNDSFETSIILGLVNFASTFFGIYLLDRIGRRQILKWGAAAQACCFAVFASIGVTRLYPNGYSGISSQGAGNCMIVFACFYIFSFASSWAPATYVVISETYPLRIRSKAMAIAQSCNWMWGFLISFFTPFITSAIHFYYGYVFMGCLVFAFFYVHFFLYETKDLRLEDIDALYASDFNPLNSSKYVSSQNREELKNFEEPKTTLQKV